MGWEREAVVRVGQAVGRCQVLLETKELICRGEIKRTVPHAAMVDLAARRGSLTFLLKGESFAIELGDDAEAWVARIRNPKSRVQKLGIEPGLKVCVLGPAESDVLPELEAAGATTARRLSEAVRLVLLFAEEPADLARLEAIESSLGERGAVWVLWPKGRKDFAHEDVVAAAKSAKLVQTKSMGFSEKFTGLRLTRPSKKSDP